MKKLVIAAACVAAAGSPALALGPVDVDAGVVYWASDVDDGTDKVSADAPGAFVDLGLGDHWVIGGSYQKAEPDGGQDLDFTNLSLKYKFLSASRNNFFAVGAGAERFEAAGESGTSARVFVEGRVSVKIVYFYARAAYLPSLADLGPLTGDKGQDLDAGIAVKPAPFFYLYAGYMDKTRTFDQVELQVKGPYAGVGFNF